MWDLWWTGWHWDRFFPEYFGFPVNFIPPVLHLLGKMKKTDHLHHKGCTISLKAAACP
jgi:hypothetical protein